MRWIQIVVVLALCVACVDAVACRYSVREVGFVDLEPSRYTLYAYVDDGVEQDFVTLLKREAFLALMDTPIDLEVVHLEQDAGHLGLEYVKEDTFQGYPALMLVSPEGYSWSVDLAGDDGTKLEDSLLSFAGSVLRTQIRDNLEHFCTLLFLSGKDEAANTAAKDIVDAAIAQVILHMSDMDKATELPPVLLQASHAEALADPVLLWSLGLDAADLELPRVAVLFGKARRMGGVLRGDRVSEEELVKVIGLIGASCECGLDRKWMQGTMVPMEWGDDIREQMVDHLGFDPESPLVKTEMSQIIAKGMGKQGSGTKVNDIFDYQEFQVLQDEGGTGEIPVVEDVVLGEATVMDAPEEMTEVTETVVALEEDIAIEEDLPEPGLSSGILWIGGFLIAINLVGILIVLRKRGLA